MRKQTRWKLLDPDSWQVDKIVRSRDWELLRLKDFTFEKPTHPSKIVQKKEDTAKSGHLRWIQPLAKLISFTFLTFPHNFPQKYSASKLNIFSYNRDVISPHLTILNVGLDELWVVANTLQEKAPNTTYSSLSAFPICYLKPFSSTFSQTIFRRSRVLFVASKIATWIA